MSIDFDPQTGTPTNYDGPTDQGSHFIELREAARKLESIHTGEELPEPAVELTERDQRNTNKLVQFICRFLKPKI